MGCPGSETVEAEDVSKISEINFGMSRLHGAQKLRGLGTTQPHCAIDWGQVYLIRSASSISSEPLMSLATALLIPSFKTLLFVGRALI